MNTKVVYIAGVAILMVGIVFYIINSGFFSSDNSISSLNNSTSTSGAAVKPTSFKISSASSNSNIVGSGKQQQGSSDYENLTVSAKYVNISQINSVPSLLVALDVHNPNRGAAILDTLSYGVYFNGVRLGSADIGTKPQGFIDSLSSVYPIIGNQTITLKDKQPLTPEGSALFNSNGTLIHNSNSNIIKTPGTPNSYVINGTFSTTLARGTQSQNSETPFSLQFPLK